MKASELTIQVFKSILVITICCYPFHTNYGYAEDNLTQKGTTQTGTAQVVEQEAILAVELTEIRKLASRGEYSQALSDIEKLIESAPGSPRLVFIKATILESAGNPVEAVKLYLQLTVSHPELAEPFNNLAVHYMDTGDYESAISILEAAFSGHPGYAAVFSNLQSIYDRLASDAYRKALDLETPSDELELISLGQIQQQPTTLISEPKHIPQTAQRPSEHLAPEVAAVDKTNEIVDLPVPEEAEFQWGNNTPNDGSGFERIVSGIEENLTPNNTKQPETAAVSGEDIQEGFLLPATAEPSGVQQIDPRTSDSIINSKTLEDSSSLSLPETASSQGIKATEDKSLSSENDSELLSFSEEDSTIRNRIENWADAWSRRDLDRYLSYYSSEFVPRYNLTLEQWKKHQHALWRWRKLIVVELSDLSIDITGNDAIVTFTQYYKSNTFENTIGKTLELKQKNGSWYITREFI